MDYFNDADERSGLIEEVPTVLRIAVLFLLVLAGAFLFVVISWAIVPLFGVPDTAEFISSAEMRLEHIYATLITQFIQNIGVFMFPALLFAWLVRGRIIKFFGLDSFPSSLQIFLAFAIMFTSLIFIEWLVFINEHQQFAGIFGEMQKSMQSSEAEQEAYFVAFAQLKQPADLILLLIVMAVTPAIGEELIFRGILQKQFIKGGMKPVLAIIFSGFLFSLVHWRFDQFMAIWFMGIILGSLYHVSGKLWLPILAHFFNNALIVLVGFFSSSSSEPYTIEPTQNANPWQHFPFIFLIMLLFYFLHRVTQKRNVETVPYEVD